MRDPKRILVVLPNWVGDAVMATPGLRALRRRFGDSHITLTGRVIVLDTLSALPVADAMVTDMSRQARGTGGMLHALDATRRGRYDLAVLMPNSFRSALIARLAGVPRIVGYARDVRSWLLTDSRRPPRGENGVFTPLCAIDYYNGLFALLGATTDSRRMELAVAQDDDEVARRMLREAHVDSTRPVVLLNPGASFGVSKMWEPSRFAALGDMLAQRHGAQIIINAAPNERAIGRQVAEAMRHDVLINTADDNCTIGQLKAMLGLCDLVVTGDTGTRHLAAGLGRWVVTLFGSTDPLWSTIDYERERIVRLDLPCSPCHLKMCPQPAGPLYHKCMADMTPEMVLPAAEEALRSARGAAESGQ